MKGVLKEMVPAACKAARITFLYSAPEIARMKWTIARLR